MESKQNLPADHGSMSAMPHVTIAEPESVVMADSSSAHDDVVVASGSDSSLATPTRENKNNNISISSNSDRRQSLSTTTTTTTTIVDEAQECLAQSLFMFLYADLRLLSATGRINTKFETLCIDSDKVQRTTSAQMAQLVEKSQSPTEEGERAPSLVGTCEGVSPGQVMAILFVELRQEVLAQRKRAKEQLKERGWVPNLTVATDTDDDDDDDAGLLNKITDRKGRKEFETDMHALIRSYNDMLAHDLRGIPEVKVEKKVTAPPTILGNGNATPFRKAWLFPNHISQRLFSFDDMDNQPLPQHDPSNADTDDEGSKNSKSNTAVERFRNVAMLLRKTPLGTSPGRGLHTDDDGGEGVTKRDNARETHLSQINESQEDIGLDETTTASNTSKSIMQSPDTRRNDTIGKRVPDSMESSEPAHNVVGSPKLHIAPGIKKHLATYVEKIREDQVLHHRLIIPADDYETFAGAEDVGNKLVQMTSRLNLPRSYPMPPESASSSEDTRTSSSVDAGRNMSEKELLDFMTKCIESRNTHSLDFMADFFRDNTVSQTMVKSEAQVVWLQDWFQIKDCIYAISVDKKKKRVLVLFRGATTRADWNHAFDTSMKRGHNPVKEEYEGKMSHLKVHSGFYTYLFRIRKDTHTRKYDEIANKVYEYGHKMIGSDFTVTVNGYSLGGALSLLFGFYASTDERFTNHGPVKIFTYGMPYCVGHSFADAFRHQEKKKMVQHARFYNNNDIVSHLPLNLTPTKRGSSFVHVGIDVKLYPVPGKLSLCGSRYPKIHYNDHQSAMRSYLRALRMNCFLNMTLPWRIKHVHSLPQLQKRIARATSVAEVAKATKNPFLRSTLDEAYEAMVYSRKGK